MSLTGQKPILFSDDPSPSTAGLMLCYDAPCVIMVFTELRDEHQENRRRQGTDALR